MALRTLAAATAVTRLKPRTSPPFMAMSRILHLHLSFGLRHFGTPAYSQAALGRNLEQNNVNSNGAADDGNPMLVVEWVNNNLSLLSTEKSSLQLVQPNRPNFSRLNSSACYEFLAGCDKWLLLGSEDIGITTPAHLLWDPMTDEVRPIPEFQMKPHLPIAYSWYTFCGVGFDSGSGDYKVVRCSNRENVGNEAEEVRGELLSIDTGSWREIRLPHNHDDLIINYVHCIHINGFYYWPATLLSDCSTREVIVPFDFGREEFPADLIPMPDIVENRRVHSVLVEYHGSLAVIFYDSVDNRVNGRPVLTNEDPFWFDIRVWSEGGRSWSRLTTANVPANAGVTEVVGLYNNDKVILEDSRGALLVYDCRTVELESFGVTRKDDDDIVYPRYSLLRVKRDRSSYEAEEPRA